MSQTPSKILIVGAGVLGLSTALALVQRPKYSQSNITVLDAASEIPNSVAASVDTSRVLRADYALKAYTKLVSESQTLWGDQSVDGWGGEGRYHDAKLPGTQGHVDGYLEESLENAKDLARSGDYAVDLRGLRELPHREAIAHATLTGGASGDFGYYNERCGWADAEKCVRYAIRTLQRRGGDRVSIKTNAGVRKLLYAPADGAESTRCTGIELHDGSHVFADLVILAAGAWTPSLVDLEGRAAATGQVLAYLPITEHEQRTMGSVPIYFNVSRGMFMVPPHNRELKVGRHGFGYQNPMKVSIPIPNPGGDLQFVEKMVSVPRTDLPIPLEAEKACKEFLVELFPDWRNRQFSKTRVCWYCDTPTGDFIIDYYPRATGLFLATGDSGHAFKILPIIGEKVVDAIDGNLEPEYRELWKWKTNAPGTFQGTNDGTRGGRRDMILQTEARTPTQPRETHL
ncbi:fructosyl amino acid oxidase [Aspergillus steynii IBT 23096]|uniref:Fructosyl amino acid oxidase n=1 Tax=Aspergillus steynii IBT 23096 TaxID=1392250 RepID=A0A2I2FTI3_9EURO|nr:fructosyl amino acid oxidase [Aspergillus steynii IBT 23096]PLB43924.1 fructosyl amino acid oxidase [Aspergillus steynii IBT 23096]